MALLRRSAVFVDTEMHRVFGGAQVFLTRLLPSLGAETGGPPQLVVDPLTPRRLVEWLRNEGIDVDDGVWPAAAIVPDAAALLARAVGARPAASLVVSVSSGIGWAAIPLLAAEVPVVAIVHSDSETFYAPLRHYAKFLSAAVAVSTPIRERLAETTALPPERIREIPYGVAIEPWATLVDARRGVPGRRLECLYAGRLVRQDKRSERLVPILRAARGCRVVVAGDGPARAGLEAALAPQVAAGSVVFTGWLSEAELRERRLSADVLLFTSESEGLPIALLEGLACGLVPLATDIPAFRAVVRDGENGWLLDGDAAPAFAARLHQLQDAARLGAMRRSAWLTAQRYSLGAMRESYEQLLRDCDELNRSAAASRPAPDYPLLASCVSRYPAWLRRLKARARRAIVRVPPGGLRHG